MLLQKNSFGIIWRKSAELGVAFFSKSNSVGICIEIGNLLGKEDRIVKEL